MDRFYYAIEKFSNLLPDLVLLDITLPYEDGYVLCKKIRAISNVPILMISARTEEIEQIMAIELGADDYIVKPSFVLLYLNLLTDIDVERAKFQKLFKIGITKKELKQQLNYETALLFFIPTMIGHRAFVGTFIFTRNVPKIGWIFDKYTNYRLLHYDKWYLFYHPIRFLYVCEDKIV